MADDTAQALVNMPRTTVHKLALAQRSIFRAGGADWHSQVQQVQRDPNRSQAHLRNMDQHRSDLGYDVIGHAGKQCASLLHDYLTRCENRFPSDTRAPARSEQSLLLHIDHGGGAGGLGTSTRQSIEDSSIRSRYHYESHDIAEHIRGVTKVIQCTGPFAGHAQAGDGVATLYTANQMTYSLPALHTVIASSLRCLRPGGVFLSFNPPNMWDKGSRYYQALRQLSQQENALCRQVQRTYWDMGRGGDFMVITFIRTDVATPASHPVDVPPNLYSIPWGIGPCRHVNSDLDKVVTRARRNFDRRHLQRPTNYVVTSDLLLQDGDITNTLSSLPAQYPHVSWSSLALWVDGDALLPSCAPDREDAPGDEDSRPPGMPTSATVGGVYVVLVVDHSDEDNIGQKPGPKATVHETSSHQTSWQELTQQDEGRSGHQYRPLLQLPGYQDNGSFHLHARERTMRRFYAAVLALSLDTSLPHWVDPDHTLTPEEVDERARALSRLRDQQLPACVVQAMGLENGEELSLYIRDHTQCSQCHTTLTTIFESHPRVDFTVKHHERARVPYTLHLPQWHKHGPRERHRMVWTGQAVQLPDVLEIAGVSTKRKKQKKPGDTRSQVK